MILFQNVGGRLRFRQWDYDQGASAARLHVEFQVPGTLTPTPTASSSASPTQTRTLTSTPSPPSTLTPSASPTLTSTITDTPTATATATPEMREVTIDYQYDPLNRLIGSDYTFTGTGSTGEYFYYAYDAVGNPVSLRSRDGRSLEAGDARRV